MLLFFYFYSIFYIHCSTYIFSSLRDNFVNSFFDLLFYNGIDLNKFLFPNVLYAVLHITYPHTQYDSSNIHQILLSQLESLNYADTYM
jgi:hypothetical protein